MLSVRDIANIVSTGVDWTVMEQPATKETSL